MAKRQARIFGWLLVAVWLSALCLLVPLPSTRIAAIPEADPATLESILAKEQKATGLPRADLQRAALSKLSRESAVIWIHWIGTAVVISLGVLAGVGALKAWRYWSFLAFLSSILYLAAWAISVGALPTSNHRSILDSFIAYLVNAVHSDQGVATALFLHVQLILPIAHFLIASFLLYVRPGIPTSARP